jgi:hypothetical protein
MKKKKNTFTAKRFWTEETIEIPLEHINSIEERSTIPNWTPDHTRVCLNWINSQAHPLNDKEWLLLIWLESMDDLVKATKHFMNKN